MLESLINPRSAEKSPWKMLFIGILYGGLSLLFVHWFFSGDPALSKASGMLVVLFCLMFSLPFMYFIIRIEEKQDEETEEGFFKIWKIHKDAIYALLLLFVGFVIAFSVIHVVLQNDNLLNFQIETYCQINNPSNVEKCVENSGFDERFSPGTGAVTKTGRFFLIIENNVFVMIFTLLFSLIFGAGAIFILIWNASVIAAAIGIFSKYQISEIPLGLARYLIHGIPEIAAYFITALAGGIFGVGILRNGFQKAKSMRVIENSIILLFISLVILIIAAVIEVYLTPVLFK